MRSNPHIFVIISTVAALVAIVACRPHWISDSNEFLSGFINHEYLNVLGVILAITLASLAQIHLTLNEIEERRNTTFTDGTRSEIRSSAVWLIAAFVVGVIVVLIKPLVGESDTVTAIFNAFSLLVLLFYVLVLVDITMAIFDLKPEISDDGEEGPKKT